MTGEKNDGFVFIDRFICLEELCKLCHISKRKAKWLLDNEIIPCIRSGNERHRYKIKLSDATAFQKDQESDHVIYTYPKGQFSSKRKRESSRAAYIRRMASIIRTEKGQAALRSFYQKEFAKVPDCLYARDIVALTGFSVSSVRAWITAGELKAYSYGVHRIPKEYLIDFVCSNRYICAHVQSEKQRETEMRFLRTYKSNKGVSK